MNCAISTMKMAIAALGFLQLSACVIVPVPTFESEPFGEELMESIVPGKTNRKQVLAMLGEPNSISDDEQMFLYRGRHVHSKLLILTTGGGGLSDEDTVYFLFVAFGRDGIVTKINRTNQYSEYCELARKKIKTYCNGEWRRASTG